MDVLRHSVPKMEKATALFAFQGSEASSQISLAFNEEVSVKEKANEEWWWVINNSGKICIKEYLWFGTMVPLSRLISIFCSYIPAKGKKDMSLQIT